MWPSAIGRARHWHTVIRRSAWPIFAGLLSLVGSLAFIRDEFLPQVWQVKLKMPYWLPAWHWYWWIISALSWVIVAILEGSYREHRDLPNTMDRSTADANGKRTDLPKIEICFAKGAPYEVSDVQHHHVLSTVRIGLKNVGGGALSNCKVYIDKIVPEPPLPGGLPILLNAETFTLRHDDPEKFVDIASHWDHVAQYRFSAPISGAFYEALGYIDSKPQRTILVKVDATEGQRSATFKIWTDEAKALHLECLGYVS
jgi:hypothetical protein